MTNRSRQMPMLDTSIPLMVGREPEQAHVRVALAAAIAGQGRVLLIGGEAGIGKTTLVEDLARHAREQHALVLTGRCFDQSVTPPYGPWVAIARRYHPSGDQPPFPTFLDDAQALAALGSQEHLFAAVTAFFIELAARQPLVLVLDDLHWADQGSLDLLRYLAREASEHRFLVLLTYRSDEITRRHPLSHLVPALVREAHAERLTLAPLDPDAVMTLVATRYPMEVADQRRLAIWLVQRSAGHPLYLHELLRSLEEDRVLARRDDGWVIGDLGHVRVPSLVQGVIEARLARLGDDARAVLEIAAVIGQETSIDLLVAISDVPDALLADAVERATAAHIVEEVRDGAGFRFTHALIRETLYEGIGSLRRRALHRQIGAVLASHPTPEPDAIATHFQQAADARAVSWLVLAGERAQQAYAWNTAVERYGAALTMLTAGDGDPQERGWLQYRIGRLERFRRPEEAVRHLDEALRLAAAAHDRALTAATRYSQGLCRFYTGDLVTAIEDLAVGADMLEALPLEEQERLGLGVDAHGVPAITTPRGFLVLVLSTVGRLAEALRMGEAMREGEPAPSSLGELWWAHYGDRSMGLGEAYALLGRVEEARDALQYARSIFRANGHYRTQAASNQVQLQLVSIPYGTEHLAEHERLAAEAEAAELRAVGATFAERSSVARAPILALTGHWDAAVLAAQAALTMFSASGIRGHVDHQICHAILGPIAHARGQIDEAWSHVHALLPSGAATEPGRQFYWAALAMQRLAVGLLLDAGDLPAAHTWLDAYEHWLAWSGAVLGRSEAAALQAQYHRSCGALTPAREAAERAVLLARRPRQPLALLAALRLMGELDTATGHRAESETHFRDALALAEACHAPYEQALTLAALAKLQAASSPATALATVAPAHEIGMQLGAAPLLARIDALTATLTSPKRHTNPSGLTQRETQVLRLVAQGLSDAEVAARLFISPRTVGTHLTAIYTKLDVASRTAAVHKAAEQGIT